MSRHVDRPETWGTMSVKELAEMIIENKSDPNMVREVASRRPDDLVQILNKVCFGDCGLTPLLTAVMFGTDEAVETLLNLGADPNLRTRIFTPIGDAAFQGKLNVVKMLINCGVPINGSYFFLTESPLLAAVDRGHLHVVEYLLECGADPNTSNAQPFGRDALGWADSLDIFALLLKHGARPSWSYEREYDWTRLYHYFLIGRYDEAKLLLEYGANPYHMLALDRKTVFDVMQELNDNRALEILEPYRGRGQSTINV